MKRHGSEVQSDERNDDDHKRDRCHNVEHFKFHRVGFLKMGIVCGRESSMRLLGTSVRQWNWPVHMDGWPDIVRCDGAVREACHELRPTRTLADVKRRNGT